MKQLKVCGLRDNFREVCTEIKPDFAGLIFYPPSSRYVGDKMEAEAVRSLSGKTQKIGVFVNATNQEIRARAADFGLDGVQLHGEETPEQAAALRQAGLLVIKAFRIGTRNDMEPTADYTESADFFLFDARGKDYGGNGIRFDWEILQTYAAKTPFFLSGGIGEEHAEALRDFTHPQCVGVDINSGFETAPAQKSVAAIARFRSRLTK